MRLPFALLFVVFAAGAPACSASTTDAAPADAAASDEASACGPMHGPDCFGGAAGRACADVAYARVCVDGAWSCPAGTTDACGCNAGPSPGSLPKKPGDACDPPRDAGGPVSDAADAADAADVTDVTDVTETSDASETSDTSDDADAARVDCALGHACTSEGATCTWHPSCGFPPSVSCTCIKGVWSCAPACI